MRRTSYLLFLGLFLFACGPKTSVPQADTPVVIKDIDSGAEEKVEEVNTTDEDEGEEPVYLLCELKRTSCYGKCPSFHVKLYSDGKVTYHGKAHVARKGQYVAFCEPQQFESIFTAAEQANYFVLRSQYPADGKHITDLPKTITYLKRNGLEKRIINQFDAPKDLVQFEKWLDAFFDSLQWEVARG